MKLFCNIAVICLRPKKVVSPKYLWSTRRKSVPVLKNKKGFKQNNSLKNILFTNSCMKITIQ